MLKTVELRSLENKSKIVKISVNKKVSKFIEENFIKNLEYFEKKNKLKINILTEENLNLSEYIINFQSKTKKTIEKIEKITELKKIVDENKKETIYLKNKTKKNKGKRKNFFKKKFYKKN